MKNQIFKFLIVEDEIIAEATKRLLKLRLFYCSCCCWALEKKQLKSYRKLSRLGFNGYD